MIHCCAGPLRDADNNIQGMLRQILKYSQRRLADTLHLEDLGAEKRYILAGIKFIMMELEEVRDRHHKQYGKQRQPRPLDLPACAKSTHGITAIKSHS